MGSGVDLFSIKISSLFFLKYSQDLYYPID